MPIHDQSYRRYRGPRGRARAAWIVIARAGIRSMLGQRLFLGLLIAAWVPFLVRAVQIYLAANFPQFDLLNPSTNTYREFLEQQALFVFFITIYVGAGLIANDRRAHALQVYLAKPLTRTQYIAGKLAIVTAFLLLVSWLPGVLLLVVQVLFEGDLVFVTEHPWLVPAITGYSVAEVSLSAFSMLALSSLSTSSRYVAVMYAGVTIFTGAVSGVLHVITGGTGLAWISFAANVTQIGDVLFSVQPRYDSPWTASVVVVLVIIVGSVAVLERRVRGVEVVT
jgi:ABC-2 type transport system permease protein